MSQIQISYQIAKADYAEANALVWKHRRLRYPAPWLFFGSAALLLLLPLSYRTEHDWDYPVLVVPFGGYLIYVSLLYFFPYLAGLLHYRRTNLAGRRYDATFSENEVGVAGKDITSIHRWPSFQLIRESERLFVFYDGITMYIFAKRFFTPEQVRSLQNLIGSFNPGGARTQLQG